MSTEPLPRRRQYRIRTRSCGGIHSSDNIDDSPRSYYYTQTRNLNVSFLYKEYLRNSSRRKIPFEISEESASELFMSPCSYCGKEPIDTLNGIDRVCNQHPYAEWNVLPCCKMCNMLKGREDLKEMLLHVGRIQKHMEPIINLLEEGDMQGIPMDSVDVVQMIQGGP